MTNPPTMESRETFVPSSTVPIVQFNSSSAAENPHPSPGKSKKAFSRKRIPALFFIVQYHVPSLAALFILLELYSTGRVWPAPSPNLNELAALQFAAKIHEALVILSLSNILLHRIRYLLMSPVGVPLGLDHLAMAAWLTRVLHQPRVLGICTQKEG
ncbi:hypothetical protein B0T17DRAFT_256973 [Bombardia bombarda]|uniref:Uncharacterized protein n=1 Tax=Bombardia bombarda TaxID=252184 RepID=A0AA39X0C1_9PEZI|nr:hypothetical protein B0T17DRAFT_256973 [Bombardia bombarda]